MRDNKVAVGSVPYYGKIVDIIELNYSCRFSIVLFKFVWADTTTSRGIKQDHLGLTSVNFSHSIHISDQEDHEPYILASEAHLVYYMDDEVDKEWSAVVHVKPRDLYNMGEENEKAEVGFFPQPGLNFSAAGDIGDLQLTRDDDIKTPHRQCSVTRQMKMKDFSSCCASTTFTKEMSMVSPFSSLEHAISVAREIWFRKMNMWCWLEAISGRSCFNEYLKMANESIMQMRFTDKHAVELDITSQEEMKFIELQITQLLSKESAQTVNNEDGEIVNDTLDGAEIDSVDNLDDISSTGIDISMQFDLNKVSEEDNKTLDDQQVEDDVHVAKQRFNLNKKS
ncbi:uncharacterized protein DS421_4g124430 [Arachis hypogaea]|nr:uncharacterized protein DS421_4g124430 [Arachis hypogaea]